MRKLRRSIYLGMYIPLKTNFILVFFLSRKKLHYIWVKTLQNLVIFMEYKNPCNIYFTDKFWSFYLVISLRIKQKVNTHSYLKDRKTEKSKKLLTDNITSSCRLMTTWNLIEPYIESPESCSEQRQTQIE